MDAIDSALNRYYKQQEDGEALVEAFEDEIMPLVEQLGELQALQRLIFKTIESEDNQDKMIEVLMEEAQAIYDDIYSSASCHDWDAWDVALPLIREYGKELDL